LRSNTKGVWRKDGKKYYRVLNYVPLGEGLLKDIFKKIFIDERIFG